MGYTVLYQAIPEQAQLLEHLRSDKKIYCIFEAVAPFSFKIFNASEIDENYLNDILDSEVDAENFSSRVEAENTWKEFIAELELAKYLYPNIANRATTLKNCCNVIETALISELEDIEFNTDIRVHKYIHQFTRGSEPVAAHLSHYPWHNLYFIPSLFVKEFAEILRKIEGKYLLEKYNLSYQEEFDRWKNLYLEASLYNEALLINVI
ncbi:hypothetical protein RIVM261_059480 [Rivularia sp. IAM M-261]|nr:hypothetical protein RIVM261_059480 [Rivularia sp. IAM M-261]